MSTEFASSAMPAASGLEARVSIWRRLCEVAARYGLSASGPLSISGAHFIASLVLLRALPQAEFGLFSFALIVVPFCLGMSGALLGASIATTMVRAKAIAEPELATHLKASLAFSVLIAVAIGGLMLLSGGGAIAALLFGLYGGSMTLRWFARSYAYALGQRYRVTFSDYAYGGLLLAGLFVLLKTGNLDYLDAAAVFVFASIVALFIFGIGYLKKLFTSAVTGSLRAYGPIWRDLTRWSLLGVILTEMTANAHAYLVTFISGPKAFALLAVGSLFMRPVSLCLTALPDLERPIMARYITGGEVPRARHSVFEFRAATAAVWIATVALAIVLLFWFPHLVLKSGYDQSDAFAVLAFWAAIMAVRIFRTPESVFLQAAGEFRPLAGASMRSSVASLVLTFALLMVVGPIASLGGVLIGDLVMASRISSLSHAWRRNHV